MCFVSDSKVSSSQTGKGNQVEVTSFKRPEQQKLPEIVSQGTGYALPICTLGVYGPGVRECTCQKVARVGSNHLPNTAREAR